MKINKSIYGFILGLLAISTFSACSSDNYEGAAIPEGAQVYFSNQRDFNYLLAENQNTVTITVDRLVTAGELTVDLAATDTSGLFSVPASVTFADGKSTAEVPVTFEFAKLVSDTSYGINLKLGGSTSDYGDATVTAVVKYAPWSEWKPFGWKYPSTIKSFKSWEQAYAADSKAANIAYGGILPTYTYNLLVSGTYGQPVFVRQSMLDANKAQLMLYSWFYGVNLVIDWNKSDNTFKVAPQYSGYTHKTNGPVNVADSWTYWKTIRNEPEKTAGLKPSYYDVENGEIGIALNYFFAAGSFGDALEKIQLPGYVKPDYSLAIVDKGGYASGKELGRIFQFTMGGDVAYFKYASVAAAGITTDDDVKAVAEKILSGETASVNTTEDGLKVITGKEGEYYLVACIYDGNGKYVGYASLKFTIEK